MGGSVKLARELYLRLPTDERDVVLWGVGSKGDDVSSDHGRRSLQVSRTDRLVDFWIHLWARCLFTRMGNESLIQVFRLDFLFPFLLFHPSIRSIAILDQSLTYISTEFRWLRGILTRAFRIVESFCLRRVDRVVTDESSAAYYRELYPWLAEKLEIKSTGPVDLERFAALPSKEQARRELGIDPLAAVVVFVGRVEAVKNPKLLLASVRRLGTRLADVWLLVVGRGSHLQDLSLESQEDSRIKVVLLGEQPYDRVPLILRASDVLALTSQVEGSPTVVREALAAGIPVVSTDVGDVRRILVDPGLGTISPSDPEAFARHLEEALTRTPRKGEAAALAFTARSHSVEDFCEFMQRVYEGVVSGRESATRTSPQSVQGEA